MKEATYEEWQKNPTSRMMWVWNESQNNKEEARVIYIAENDEYSVMTITAYGDYRAYKHCAEIEEPKTRRMTNQELSWWLLDGIKEGKHREWKLLKYDSIFYGIVYIESEANQYVSDNLVIRENGGEWHEPLVEIEE